MKSDYRSMKSFDSRCQWWHPESPNRRVAGAIGFDGGRISAVLDEWPGVLPPLDSPQIDVLHGETVDGAPFSIFNAFVSKIHSSFDLTVNSMAIGANLNRLSEQQFRCLFAKLSGIDEWWQPEAFRVKEIEKDCLEITLQAPRKLAIRIPSRGLTVTIGHNRSWKSVGGNLSVKYRAFAKISSDSSTIFSEIQSSLQDLREFLALVLGQPCGLQQMTLVPATDQLERESVQWYWLTDRRVDRQLDYTRVLLSFGESESILEDVLCRWLSTAENQKTIRDLVFASEEAPAPFIESRFLPLIQAIEVYCRTGGSSFYLDDDAFSGVKQILLSAIPTGLDSRFLQKLRTSIGFSNEFGLSDRIRSVIESLQPETRDFICKDHEKFASRLVATRNYYTHYGESKGKHLTGRALHWAIMQAALLIKILMLKDCGVSEQAIRDQLRQSYYYSKAASIWDDIASGL